MVIRRVVTGAFVVMAALAGPLPAAAQVPPPGDAPRVLDPRPASGEMATSSTVTVGAHVVGAEPLGTIVVRVDGRDVGTSTPGTRRATPDAVEANVRAAAVLAPGDHVAQVLVDEQVLRAWRFTVSDLDVARLQGADRVATGLQISRDHHRIDGTADAAVLVSADDPPAMLAGAALAGAAHGPLLLTAGDGLEHQVAAELRRLLPLDATVLLLGGPEALSEQLQQDVAALGFAARRVAGEGPSATAAAAAELIRPSDGSVTGGTVVVVPVDGIGDALALASPAAARGWPILLTGPDTLDPGVRAYLAAAPPAEVLVAGDVLAPAVLRELRTVAGRVSRVRGDDPRESAQAVGEQFFDQPEVVTLAGGDDIAVALVGSVHAASVDAPLLVVSGELPDALAAAVAGTPPRRVVVYGDAQNVSERAVSKLHRAVADRMGPRIRSITPVPGSTVRDLDEVVVRFDRRVLAPHSTLSVWIDGHEVTGTLTAEGPDVLALTVDGPFPPLTPGRRYELRLVGAATDGQHWVHVDEVMRLAPRPRA